MAKRFTLAALLVASALGCETMDSCKDGLCGKSSSAGGSPVTGASAGGAVAIPPPPVGQPAALTGTPAAGMGMGAR